MSESVSTPGLEQLKCVACGEEFGCGANASPADASLNCWCAAIEITEAELAEIQDRYQGCLCRNCLTNFKVNNHADVSQ